MQLQLVAAQFDSFAEDDQDDKGWPCTRSRSVHQRPGYGQSKWRKVSSRASLHAYSSQDASRLFSPNNLALDAVVASNSAHRSISSREIQSAYLMLRTCCFPVEAAMRVPRMDPGDATVLNPSRGANFQSFQIGTHSHGNMPGHPAIREISCRKFNEP